MEAILAVGYRPAERVPGQGLHHGRRAAQEPPGPGQVDYFDELLERIREIRASERRFYQKVLDIYATSVDYQPDTGLSQQFFATVQNKMHWATHGHTAAELIHERADASKPFMGMQKTTRPGGIVRKADTAVAKNYLTEPELQVLHRIVNLYIEYAELQALERRQMTMRDWIDKLDDSWAGVDERSWPHAGRRAFLDEKSWPHAGKRACGDERS